MLMSIKDQSFLSDSRRKSDTIVLMLRTISIGAVVSIALMGCSSNESEDSSSTTSTEFVEQTLPDSTLPIDQDAINEGIEPVEVPEPIETPIGDPNGPSNGIEMGGTLPPVGEFTETKDLSAECEGKIEPIRDFFTSNPNPFNLSEIEIETFDALRQDAVFTEGACTVDEWEVFNTSELSPWAAGQLV